MSSPGPYLGATPRLNHDALWAWEQLFKRTCDLHAPQKDVKVRSQSSPWINCELRQKMNRRYKLFKKAAETKNEELWSMYKKMRNEITSDVRKAKASYFQEN